MSSTLQLSTRSPINQVSGAVLREIFLHCLPPHPLKMRQSNTTIAPLLLCQICSSWRTVALAYTTLWSHLSYCLTAYQKPGEDEFDFVKKEVEFLHWWRKNQGSVAPFLHLRVNIKYKKQTEISQELAEDAEAFLLELLTSAGYLEVETVDISPDSNSIIKQETAEPNGRFVYTNLHSLVKFAGDDVDEYGPFCLLRALEPNNMDTLSLRHLSIYDDFLSQESSFQCSKAHWSILTHLSLRHIAISIDFWFSFIRAIPNLQWGHFDIDEMEDFQDEEPEFSKPTEFTLPQLSTLCVAFRDKEEGNAAFRFSIFFEGLHLPAVRTLSLSWFISEYSSHDTVAELYTILKSTPAITTLALADSFLALDGETLPSATSKKENVEPVWKHATHLVDLQLEVPQEGTRDRTKGDVEEVLDTFVRDTLFGEGSWLGLRNPACPIRNVTIVDNGPQRYESESDGSDCDDLDWDPVPRDVVGTFTMSIIDKHAVKAPNVVFELASQSVGHVAAEAWKEWGSSV